MTTALALILAGLALLGVWAGWTNRNPVDTLTSLLGAGNDVRPIG